MLTIRPGKLDRYGGVDLDDLSHQFGSQEELVRGVAGHWSKGRSERFCGAEQMQEDTPMNSGKSALNTIFADSGSCATHWVSVCARVEDKEGSYDIRLKVSVVVGVGEQRGGRCGVRLLTAAKHIINRWDSV